MSEATRERFEQEIRQNFQHLEDGLSSEMYDGQDSPLVADMFRLYEAATEGQQELVEALRKYGDCLDSCASRTILKKVPCDCGFMAVLARYGK